MPVETPQSAEAVQEMIWLAMSLMLLMLLPKPERTAATTAPHATAKRGWFEVGETELLDG